MTTPSETQSLILSRAATRPGNLALPLPEGLVGAAAKMVVGKMIARGWLEEVEANLRRNEPMVASAVASARKAKPKPEPASDNANTVKPVAIRAGTKQAQIIAMLQRPEGATVAEMVEATGWLAHTVRGCISGALKKKLGLPITAEKVAGRGTVYRLQWRDPKP